MNLISQNFWLILAVFIISSSFIIYKKTKKKKDVEAQFIIATGILMLVFYSICFLSGICTILNFLWRWVL